MLAAINELNEHLVEADCWIKALSEGEETPPLPWAMGRLLERVRASAEAVERLARQSEGGNL
jgi:hypothetical protein